MLFDIKNNKLCRITIKPFSKERELQTLVENNLNEIFNLQFLASEFSIDKYRFDTLAFDKSNNTFIIIEYKKGRNESLIDQGLAYLHVSLDRKSDLVLLFNKVNNVNKQSSDFDWSNMRVYFISPKFTDYQKDATSYTKLPFRLFEIQRYSDSTLLVDEIHLDNSNADTSDIIADEKVSKEIKVYDEKYHTSYLSNESLVEIYEDLKNKILTLPEIEMVVVKTYIAFKKGRSNICDIQFYKDYLKVFINVRKGKLVDNLNKTEDVSEIGHNGNGDYIFNIKSDEDIEYLFGLIKQSYNFNSRNN